MAHRILILISLAAIAGCGAGRPVILAEGTGRGQQKAGHDGVGPVVSPIFLSGKFPTTDGTMVRLDDIRSKPVVLIFASDTCDVCLAESQAFRDSLKDPAKAPTVIHLLTALVGALPEDAADWKFANRIPWLVGRDETLGLYRAYCPTTTVPCTVVQLPEKGIVWTHVGEAKVDEVKKYTGEWESK